MKTFNIFIFTVLCCLAVVFSACEEKEKEEGKGVIFIEPQKKNISASGGTFNVKVVANKAWTANSDKEWLTIKPASGEGNVPAVVINVTANPSTAQDTAEVRFSIAEKSLLLTVIRAGKVEPKMEGEFSVSDTQKVRFSRGNLQYNAKNNVWRFAECQYDYIGKDNENISADYDGWIDLFGWGTSGYNGKNPWMTSKENVDYGDGLQDIAGTNYDWGVYNAISNGGNQSGMWRTLTKEEWLYLFVSRHNAANNYSVATVNGIHGLIVLPDDWTHPGTWAFTAKANNWTTNNYTEAKWIQMQDSGAVFLPAASDRYGIKFSTSGIYGRYWSSSMYSHREYAYFCFFGEYLEECFLEPNHSFPRSYGFSVRLVQDVK